MARTKQRLISKLVSQHISKCIFYLAFPPLVCRRLRWAIGQTAIGTCSECPAGAASAGLGRRGPAVLGPGPARGLRPQRRPRTGSGHRAAGGGRRGLRAHLQLWFNSDPPPGRRGDRPLSCSQRRVPHPGDRSSEPRPAL